MYNNLLNSWALLLRSLEDELVELPLMDCTRQRSHHNEGVTKKRKRKTENGDYSAEIFRGNASWEFLKKIEELPDFGLFGGNFQNRRK